MRFVHSTVLLCIGASLSAANDIGIVLERLQNLTWPSVSGASSQAHAAGAVALALNASCYWPDINYHQQNRANWQAVNHLSRTLEIAQAVSCPWSPLFKNESVTTLMFCALDVWLNQKGGGWAVNPNWWYQSIGVPTIMSDIFVAMGASAFSPSQQELGKALCLEADWWNHWGQGIAVGANLVNELQVELSVGATFDNSTAVTQAFEVAWSSIAVVNTSTDGVQVDNSYHFHGSQILSGSYGAVAASSDIWFFRLATGTSFFPGPSFAFALETFCKWMDGDSWASIFNQYDNGVIGRGIDRPGNPAGMSPSSASLRFVAPSTNCSAQLMRYADSIDGVAGTTPLVGNRHFFTSDYHVHRRPGFVATLKVHSVRTIATECDNGENLLGEHLADGVMNVYAIDAQAAGGGSEYLNIGPLFDWNSIGGTLVEHSTPPNPCVGSSIAVVDTSFVGGASDGTYGAVAFDAATHNLTAQRSWSFFDEAIVTLATNITDAIAGVDAWSTLTAQRLSGNVGVAFTNGSVVAALPNGSYAFDAGEVAWVWANNAVYVVKLETSAPADLDSLGIFVGTRNGSYATIGPFSGYVVSRYVQVWRDLGDLHRRAGNVAYAVLPNVSFVDASVAVSSFLSAFTLTATPTAHGYSMAPAGSNDGNLRVHAIFWVPNASLVLPASSNLRAAAPEMTASEPCIALLSISPAGVWTVTLAAPNAPPTLQAISITVATPAPLVGSGCSSAPDGKGTIFAFVLPVDPDYLGASISVVCQA